MEEKKSGRDRKSQNTRFYPVHGHSVRTVVIIYSFSSEKNKIEANAAFQYTVNGRDGGGDAGGGVD